MISNLQPAASLRTNFENNLSNDSEKIKRPCYARCRDFYPCSIIGGTCAAVTIIWAIVQTTPSYYIIFPTFSFVCTVVIAMRAHKLSKAATIDESANKIFDTTRQITVQVQGLDNVGALIAKETSKRQEADREFENSVSEHLIKEGSKNQEYLEEVITHLETVISSLETLYSANQETINVNQEVNQALRSLKETITTQGKQFVEEVQKPLGNDNAALKKDLQSLQSAQSQLTQQESRLRSVKQLIEDCLHQLSKSHLTTQAQREELNVQLQKQKEVFQQFDDNLDVLNHLLES